MKVLGQDDNYFQVEGANGESVQVAKKGLSPGRLDYFNSMATPEDTAGSINSEAVAQMEPGINPKTGLPYNGNTSTNPAIDAPLVADTGGVSLAGGSVNSDPKAVNPSDFALPQSQSPQSEVSSPVDDYKKGVMGEANANEQGLRQQAGVYGQLESQQNKIDAQYNQQRDDAEKQRLETEANYRSSADEYHNSKEIDQGRYWSNQSTGQKILAGVGLLMASVNPQSMQGALSAINRSIDRDIDAQKLEILKKKDKMNEAKGLLSDFNRKFQNIEAARHATKMAALEKAKFKLEAIGTQTKSQTMQSKAQQAVAQIEIELMKTKGLFDKEMANKSVNAAGYSGKVNSPVEAKDFRNLAADMQSAKSGIAKLREINKTPFKSLRPNLRAEAQVTQKAMIGKLRVALTGPGTMSDSDKALLEQVIANPTDFFSLDSSNEAKYKQLEETIDRTLRDKANSLGLQQYNGVDFKAK